MVAKKRWKNNGIYGRMETDRQMDGIQRDRWIDRLTDQRTDGLNGWMDKWAKKHINRQTDGWTARRTDIYTEY